MKLVSRISIVIIILMSSNFSVHSEINATIYVNTNQQKMGYNKPILFGGFIEFLNDYINGSKGMYAQELANRGFDLDPSGENGISCYWHKKTNCPDDGVIYELVEDRYNHRGKYSQKITKTCTGVAGIEQQVYITDDTYYNFYIFYKGESTIGKVNISVLDGNSEEVLYSIELSQPNSNWQKSECTLPKISGIIHPKIYISIEGTGEVYLDESSLMPANNILGVRKEYYDLYKEWEPGILRYPGGWFADCDASHWEFGIGGIDQRKSPNLSAGMVDQRLDFGTDEFIAFCKELKIEPHLTVNLGTGTPEEAAAWVEYCNGTDSTKYGAKRAENGHKEPYNVKYWEIGNEQWENPVEMTKKYLKYYDAMFTVDSTISMFIDGDLWQGNSYFDKLMSTVGNKCELYGWHYAAGGVPKILIDDSIRFMAMAGASVGTEDAIINYEKLLIEKNLLPHTCQGITEWWSDYGNAGDWLLDTNLRNSSLESGIFGAANLNTFIRYPESFILSERTCGIGLLRRGTDSVSGKKIIYGTPTYHVLKMMRHHTGGIVSPTIVDCEKYNVCDTNGLPWVTNVPWIDASTTATGDSVFLSVINRHPNQDANTKIEIDNVESDVNLYVLNSESYMDSNTPETPLKVAMQTSHGKINGNYIFPAHSFTIISFKRKPTSVDDSRTKFNLSFFPNPFSEFATIKYILPSASNVKLSIYDIFGRAIFVLVDGWQQAGVHYSQLAFNKFQLSNGIYFFSIKSEGISEVIKIGKID